MAGFFDRIFKRGKAYFKDQSPALACELTIGGHQYMLEEFDIDFDSDIGRSYVPIYVVFADSLQAELEVWIANDTKRMDGVVKFYKHENKLEEGAVFTITFHGASCFAYKKVASEEQVFTSLTLAARGINMLDSEL